MKVTPVLKGFATQINHLPAGGKRQTLVMRIRTFFASQGMPKQQAKHAARALIAARATCPF